MLKHAKNPLERLGQLVPTSPRVEQSEDVEGDNGVGAWPFSVKVGLPRMVQLRPWYVGGDDLPL